MPKQQFSSRSQLVNLIRKVPWSSNIGGQPKQGSWGIAYVENEGKILVLKNPVSVIIFLDRHLEEDLHGYVWFHGPINAFLGFTK